MVPKRLALASSYREGASENALRIAWSAAVKLAAGTAESPAVAGEIAVQMQKIVREPIAMKGADLRGENLADAWLAGADLVGALLSGTMLNGANLSGASLFRADLAGCMVETICENVDFTRCDCTETRFAKARLNNALWEQANIDRMTCPDAEACPEK